MEDHPWQPAGQQTPAERPLPPTPVDDGKASTPAQGAMFEPRSPPDEQDAEDEIEDEPSGQNTSPQRRKDYPTRMREARDIRYRRTGEHDAASEIERQPTALEGPSQGISTPQDEITGHLRGADISNLDIYGSSGEEGSGHRDVASKAIDGSSSSIRSGSRTTPRRKSSSIPHHSYRREVSRNDEGAPEMSSSAIPYTPFGQTRRRRSTRTEVGVPRWQPDAEVTFCPICRTQFSFFVRKHHCRKCGRVVCNSCSPHRITIPYQYIVQPPTEIPPSTSRPSVNAARIGSSSVVASLGGGERVRLCNPCVPDPNISPLQTRSDGQSLQQGHSRSASSAAVPYSPSGRGQGNLRDFYPQGRQSSSTTFQNQSREWMTSDAAQQGISSSLGGLSSPLLRPEGLESRSRSSTVGSSREPPDVGDGQNSRSTQHLVPRSEVNLSHALPNPPGSHPRTHSTRRRRIAEDDECWVCHEELPSRTLPDHEALREAHVAACVQSALDGTHRSTPPPNPSTHNNNVSVSVSASGHITTSRNTTNDNNSTAPSTGPAPPTFVPTATPIANTPEARTAQRERNHAAIVYGRSPFASSSSSHGVLSRVIPYVASEKDCVDDAECTICLEEFEVGQHMGRLECFCRFHMSCIQGWFEQKPGKCPVHGVDN